MISYKLTPLDTLFFRDGRPFNLGETGQMEVEGVFPPSPTTVVGAMRAALARNRDWQQGSWSSDIKRILGDGEILPGSLEFCGPYLLRNGEPLFPAPLYLLGKQPKDKGERWTCFLRLAPNQEKLRTDIGNVNLPKPTSTTDGHKALERCYLTRMGMKAVLEGGTPSPEQVYAAGDLWTTEPRVGIKRDSGSRTTKEDSLYQIQQVRLREDVSLAVQVEGLPDDWQPQSPALLGGESRMVWVETTENITLPQAPTLQPDGGTIRYTVTLITPAAAVDESWCQSGVPLFGLPGEIISACVGKPLMIGGWDSIKGSPLPLRAHLPAGSSWFIEAAPDDAKQILDIHGEHIGSKVEWGYGQILIGTWRKQ